MDLGEFIEKDGDEYKRTEVMEALYNRYNEVVKKSPSLANTSLFKNIQKLKKLIYLDKDEMEILALFVLVRQYLVLEEATELLGNELNYMQIIYYLSKILGISKKRVEQIINESILFRSGFIGLDERGMRHHFDGKIEFLNENIPNRLFRNNTDILELFKDSFRRLDPPTLTLKDYSHLQKDLDILIPYLQQATKTGQKGVNILLYGKPGTGKTELAKLLAKILKRELFEVSYVNENDEATDGSFRLKAYKSAQIFLQKHPAILLYDEAEDVFESSRGLLFAPPQRQKDKAWINRTLESNSVPTIWVTNNIYSIDPAIVRRFDFALEVPIPPISKRKEVLKKYTKIILDEQSIEIMAKNEHIAPALVSRAAKVVQTLNTKKKKERFINIINNTLKAQGYKEIVINSSSELPTFYNPAYINSSVDLEELAQGIANNPNARVCLYGAPGTGKSAYAKYIAKLLQKPIIIKKASELLSMWVGETEKNIARAFEEAKKEDAVLVFDEVDSFLQDRNLAQRSWEITQVNEMLVQMESFDGVFFATTNLIDNLDRASLRRFDLKIEFGFLRGDQVWELFKAYAKELSIEAPKELQNEVKSLRFVTPGDFAAIVRQSRFRPIKDGRDLLERLKEEIELKRQESGSPVGFRVP